MIRRIDVIPSWTKLLIVVSYDAIALAIAFFSAYFLRLGITGTSLYLPELLNFFALAAITLLLFGLTGVYRFVIRHFNTRAYLRVQSLLVLATIIFYLQGFILDAFVPRSVPIVFLVFATVLIAGARGILGTTLTKQLFEEREAVVIYGASSTGRQLAQSLFAGHKYQPVAFLDQKSHYLGRNINGLKVYPTSELSHLTKKYGQFKVLIAVPKVDEIRLKQIVNDLEPYAVELLIIPSVSDLVSGKRTIDELREVSVEELLGRKPVKAIPKLLSANITDKVVMVSGAGGSIGKELCRQIIQQKPKTLVLLEVSEAFLYEINQELSEVLSEFNFDLQLIPLIGNVQNGLLMTHIFHQHKVQTIYHAAAYKHVPMVENNVIAGVNNNVMGTYEIAKAAVECNVETFVLISTDKAVRPTNIMGATKRLAELVLQGLAKQEHDTRFVMVRFGNVLGSSGSVVPLFKKQIKNGGPITITHPDIIRYFMTIPEAAQLVIQAGAMGKGGDVFLLDMGEPVKIVDLAYKMTHLMGLTIKDATTPDGDIAIEYSGLRPGEKLYEELLIDDDAKSTKHQRILSANERSLPWENVTNILYKINEAMKNEDVDTVRLILLEAPLDYQPETHSKNAESTTSEADKKDSKQQAKLEESLSLQTEMF